MSGNKSGLCKAYPAPTSAIQIKQRVARLRRHAPCEIVKPVDIPQEPMSSHSTSGVADNRKSMGWTRAAAGGRIDMRQFRSKVVKRGPAHRDGRSASVHSWSWSRCGERGDGRPRDAGIREGCSSVGTAENVVRAHGAPGRACSSNDQTRSLPSARRRRARRRANSVNRPRPSKPPPNSASCGGSGTFWVTDTPPSSTNGG